SRMLLLKALQSWHGSRQIFASAYVFSCTQLLIVLLPLVPAISFHRGSSSTVHSIRSSNNDCHVIRMIRIRMLSYTLENMIVPDPQDPCMLVPVWRYPAGEVNGGYPLRSGGN